MRTPNMGASVPDFECHKNKALGHAAWRSWGINGLSLEVFEVRMDRAWSNLVPISWGFGKG